MQQSYNQDSEYTCKVQETILESFIPIPYADADCPSDQKSFDINPKIVKNQTHDDKKSPISKVQSDASSQDFVEAVNEVVINRETIRRGKLDKSFSTPTYDNENGMILQLKFYV